jgi:hypothetical protein
MKLTDLRKQTIIACCKIRKLTDRCHDSCAGWAVFEEDTGLAVLACDACWHGVKDRLTDDEAAALPEARQMLIEECEHMNMPMSVWQRSLGFPGLPKLTKAEREQLKKELEAGRRYMAKTKRGQA